MITKRLAALKDRRVLDQFVVSFGDAQRDDPQVLAQVVAGGADQVADVLDPQRVDPAVLKAVCGGGDHAGVQVAHAVGIDLHDRHADLGHPLGIDLARDVAFDHGGRQPSLQPLEQAFQQRRLAATRRTDQIDAVHPCGA